jgi:TnpA family transposase
MARKEYFSYEERKRFDTPPVLSNKQRYIFNQLPQWAENFIKTIITPTNQIGFLIQLGYFRIVCRFFEPLQFHQNDIFYVIETLKSIDPNAIDMAIYQQSSSYYNHQQVILNHLGFSPFSLDKRAMLLNEAQRLTHLQIKPTNILDLCMTFLRERRIEIPAYSSMQNIIHNAFSDYEIYLEKTLDKHLHQADKDILDELLNKDSDPFERYEITFFKRIPQSMQPSIIKKRVELFKRFKRMFQQLNPVIMKLNLSDGTIRYYAQYVLDNRSANMARRGDNKYLLLIAFVIHQYLSLGDALVLTLLHAMSSSLNHCESNSKEQLYKQRHQTTSLVGVVTKRTEIHIDTLGLIEKVVNDVLLNDSNKIFQIKNIIHQKKINPVILNEDQQQVISLKLALQKIQQDQELYGFLEKESVHLQNRVSALLQCLVFDENSSQTEIWLAINYFQQKSGEISQNSLLPLDFLSINDRSNVYTDAGKLKVSLYKALLFKEVVAHLKAGSLNVLSSYEYRSYEKYLIDKQQWKKKKDYFLKQASLEHCQSAGKSLLLLNDTLNQQFEMTNKGLSNNAAVYFDKEQRWHLHRYKASDDTDEMCSVSLYPQRKVISILDVLNQINELTGFLTAFQYNSVDYIPKRPDDKLFYAAIMGYGENIGIRKMGLISKNIIQSSLESVATHYFSPEMTLQANDLILSQSNQLPIIDLFRNQSDFVHTGSDGQKFDVSIAYLRASASFKYFGNGKGITIYSHLDEAGQLIYSTVFSAADREAPYILDALAYDEIISADAHSTDTHGYSEVIAAITGIWGIESRPRLASIYKLQLYSIDSIATFKERGYRILPSQKVDYELIVEYWDDILRLVATIKIGHEKASVILRRLSSYSRQNPLYKALKELGRLYKTIYILRYISQEDLRKSVEGILSKVENANHFAKAIMLGNTQEFNWATQYEQLTAEGCKRLIINAINYYNLLLLSEQICKCKTQQQKEDLIKIIAQTSTHTWHHINLHGEFDFSEHQNKPNFDMKAILSLTIK